MSTFTIKTSKLQDMVARAAKVQVNKLIPLTNMISIEVKDNKLTLMTTDSANYVSVTADNIACGDFSTVVPLDLFSKLIGKITTENIKITVKESHIDVKGDGVYSVPIEMDSGSPVKFKGYEWNYSTEGRVIHLSVIKDILRVNKAAAAKSIETPCLRGYYIGDKVVTTDAEVICINDMPVFKDTAYLFSPEMLELISLSNQENITVYYNNGYILCDAGDMVVYGPELDGKEDYPIDDILGYLDVAFPRKCTLPKLQLQNVIDRLSLFIEKYDKNGAYFTFTSDGLRITSKRMSSIEIVGYGTSENFAPFACCVDIPMLKSQLSAITDDAVELWYGNDVAIKIVSGKVTQVLALLEDEKVGEMING